MAKAGTVIRLQNSMIPIDFGRIALASSVGEEVIPTPLLACPARLLLSRQAYSPR